MIGMFRWIRPGLVGWGEKDRCVTFVLVSMDEDGVVDRPGREVADGDVFWYPS